MAREFPVEQFRCCKEEPKAFVEGDHAWWQCDQCSYFEHWEWCYVHKEWELIDDGDQIRSRRTGVHLM